VELQYGNEKFVLKAGDTAYYNSVVKHSLKALGGKPASIYGIVFMPF
jgi:quercetin dioxygenase-like cupin family protein